MSIMEDWRESAEWQARYRRARQFLLEYTEEGEGYSIRYITLKHYYFSWCKSIGLLPSEYSFSELYHVLVETSLVQYEPASQKSTVIGVRMRHPIGLPRYYNADRKNISDNVKEAVYAKLRSNGNVCALCGRPILAEDPVHIDHILPVRQGGSNDPANLQVVHAHCNLTKG